MYWGHHYWGMYGLWWIFWVILIGVLVLRAWPRPHASLDDALNELRRRYAAGEIDDEEYQHRLEVLQSGRPRVRRDQQKVRDRDGTEAHAD